MSLSGANNATNNDNQSSENISSILISENISDSMDNDNEISALNSENISEFSSQCSSARMECKDSSDGPDISSFPSAAEVSDSLDHFLTVSVSVPGERQNV